MIIKTAQQGHNYTISEICQEWLLKYRLRSLFLIVYTF